MLEFRDHKHYEVTSFAQVHKISASMSMTSHTAECTTLLPIKFVLCVVAATNMARLIHHTRVSKSKGGGLEYLADFVIGGKEENADTAYFNREGAVGLGMICYGVRKNSESKQWECASTGALVLKEEHHAQNKGRGSIISPHETDKDLVLFYGLGETGT
jgi:hypothetical protein